MTAAHPESGSQTIDSLWKNLAEAQGFRDNLVHLWAIQWQGVSAAMSSPRRVNVCGLFHHTFCYVTYRKQLVFVAS